MRADRAPSARAAALLRDARRRIDTSTRCSSNETLNRARSTWNTPSGESCDEEEVEVRETS